VAAVGLSAPVVAGLDPEGAFEGAAEEGEVTVGVAVVVDGLGRSK
jgi:hypothetical protein